MILSGLTSLKLREKASGPSAHFPFFHFYMSWWLIFLFYAAFSNKQHLVSMAVTNVRSVPDLLCSASFVDCSSGDKSSVYATATLLMYLLANELKPDYYVVNSSQ